MPATPATALEKANGTAAPAKAKPFNTLRDLLERAQPKLAAVVPKHLTAERLVRVALAAIGREPKLLFCTPDSVLKSVMTAASLGLEPGGALGEAYLVAYRDKKRNTHVCQFIPGYQGMIALARRSGQVASIEARVVREKDRFFCRYGLEPSLEHEPNLSDEPGELRAVYAVAHLRGGGTQFEVMSRAQVDKIRARSRSGKEGPWETDYEEMARKTAIRRLFKTLPKSIEMLKAAALSDVDEGGDTKAIDEIDGVVPSSPLSKAERLKNELKVDAVDDYDGIIDVPEDDAAEVHADVEADGMAACGACGWVPEKPMTEKDWETHAKVGCKSRG